MYQPPNPVMEAQRKNAMSCLSVAAIIFGIATVILGVIVGVVFSYCSRAEPSVSTPAASARTPTPPAKKR